MTDYISRADAHKVLSELSTEGGKDAKMLFMDAHEWIDELPSANVAEVTDESLKSLIKGLEKLGESADRPTELLDDGTLKVNVKSGAEVNRVLVWGDDGCGGLYYADDRPNIAYFCDGAACDGECNECHHTTDIKHAKNFNIIGGKYNIKYIETDYRPSGEWIKTVGEWIPVSERLPEIGQKVLVSTKKTAFTQVFKGIYSKPNVWHWEHNSIKVVAAWMPLPMPYREDGEVIR